MTLRSLPEGHLEVSAAAPGASTAFYARRFDPSETDEVRLHLWQGDDRIFATGEPDMRIRVRVVGGAGDDELHFVDPLDRVGFYDHVGEARLVNAPEGVEIDRTDYETWIYSEENPNKPVDWGTWVVPNGDLGISSDYGVFAGESSFFGGAELRLLLTRLSVLSADIGVIGFADAGRVWVDRESPGGWHVGAGGGLWAVVLAPQNTVSALAGFSEEGTRYYFFFGLPF